MQTPLRVLGLVDLLAALSLVLALLGYSIPFLLWIFGILEVIKGVAFFDRLVSVADILSGVSLIICALGWTTVVFWVFVVWLAQKSIMSLA